MQHLKKYSALLILILTFIVARFVANKLVLESSTDIYAYIPQESDFVIEINTKNFISEVTYRRLYDEAYFLEKVYPTEDGEPREEKYQDIGIDFFGKIILFREQWADESIWIAVVKYTDEKKVQSYLNETIPNAQYELDGEYMIIQLSSSSNQEQLSEHLKKISRREVKSFTERVNLSTVFSADKEINCYIIPKTSSRNQLIEGYLNFDFLADQIAIDGSFTPVPGFNESAPIAYAVNEDKALSIRSSLNLFNSVYWFTDQKIENLPKYTQMAIDYDGAKMYVVHRNQGYTTPFRSYPDVDMHFDFNARNVWHSFFDSLKVMDGVTIDSTTNTIANREGASIHYSLSDKHFELSQHGVELTQSTEEDLYFDLQMKLDPMLDNVKIMADPDNPPTNSIELSMSIGVGYTMIENVREFAKIESIVFQISKTDDDQVKASGAVLMKEKNGHSMVESFSFGQEAFLFIANYF